MCFFRRPLLNVFINLRPVLVIGLLTVNVFADNMVDLDSTSNDYMSHSANHKADSIQAAVNTMYNLEVRKIATRNEPIPTQKVEIESNSIPLLIHFKVFLFILITY